MVPTNRHAYLHTYNIPYYYYYYYYLLLHLAGRVVTLKGLEISGSQVGILSQPELSRSSLGCRRQPSRHRPWCRGRFALAVA